MAGIALPFVARQRPGRFGAALSQGRMLLSRRLNQLPWWDYNDRTSSVRRG